jgi:LysR family transcriptional regulator, low CO2-responsive transcriptional regulator
MLVAVKHATLRQLRVFDVAARHMNFSRAAEELHLSQPAVSTLIKQLAAHAGLPLFERVRQKLYLTPAGEEMLRCSRAVAHLVQETEAAMGRLRGVSGGRLNVAVISAGDYFFPRVLAEFARRHPGVELNLAVHNRESLLRCLADNLTDLAVMVRPPPRADAVAERFAPHPYVIVAAPGHPLVGLRDIPRSALLKQSFVTRERGSDTWNSMREVFGRLFSRLSLSMEIHSTETIKQAVIAGMGISFLSLHTIGLELETGRLAILDVQGFPATLSWYVVHRREKRLPPAAIAFKEFLVQEGTQLIARFVEPAGRRPSRRAAAATAER